MKLSKTLLQTMAVSVILGASVTSCTLFEDDYHTDECEEDCDIQHYTFSDDYDYCPPCGMG